MIEKCDIDPRTECIGGKECKKLSEYTLEEIYSADNCLGKLEKYFHEREIALIAVERLKIRCAVQKIKQVNQIISELCQKNVSV